jgi:biopolymer transport protein ExbD
VERVVVPVRQEVSVAHRSVALFAGLGVWIALCGACGEEEPPRGAADGIALPVVPAGVPDLAPGRAVVEVTRDGRVLFAGQGRSINELLAALAKEPTSGPLELRADGDALWMHVQWVMAALGQAGHKKVHCTVEVAGSRKQGALEVPLYRGLWEEKFWLLPFELEENPEGLPMLLGMVIVSPAGDAPETGSTTAEYQLLEGTAERTVTSQDPEAIRQWAVSFLRRSAREKAFGVSWAVEAAGAVPYRGVIVALAALQEAGVRGVEVGLEALHPWDRDRKVLPPPPHEDPIVRFVTDLSCVKPLVPMNLPVASMCEEDRDDDPDDRVIINLTATGRLILRMKEITLAGLATQLREAAQVYDRKMRAKGMGGYEEGPDGRRWSKLYVLLRADKDAPWQHARWVVAELAESRFYKLQLGVRKTAGREYTQAEAERRWAAREIYWPPPTLEGKLQCFLSTAPSEPEENYIDVRLADPPARFRFGAKTTESPEALAGWLRGAYLPRAGPRTVGRIFAGPRTPFGEIVAAVNCFNLAGMVKVDFASVKRAPDDVRRAKRLPRPR